LFVESAHVDECWIWIRNWCKKHKYPVTVYTSIKGEMKKFIEEMNNKYPMKIEKTEDEETPADKYFPTKDDLPPLDLKCLENYDMITEDAEPVDMRKQKMPKQFGPENLIILDDMSAQMKNNPDIAHLIKQHRWFHSKILISSQGYNDIPKDGRSAMSYYMLYKQIPEKKLLQLHEDMGMSIKPQQLLDLYYDAVPNQKDGYDFLYVDKRGRFRKNFDEIYEDVE
jgi:hypothetical protein